MTTQTSLSSVGRIVEEIGKGSFGTVYKMMDKQGKSFAVKEMAYDKWSEQEVDIQSECCHPNILPINNVIKASDNIYVVMPYCEYDVYTMINSFMVMDDQVKSYFEDVVKAVAYLHSQKIYHRDIKPENVMIYKNRALLADFGLACKDLKVTDCSGTSMYRAPEVNGETEYDASKQDMWSLGLLLINLLCAEDIWSSTEDAAYSEFARNPRSFLTQIYPFSDEVLDILENLLQADPSQRMDANTLFDRFSKIEKFVDDTPFSWDEGIDVDSEDKFIVGSWDSAYGSSL
eukprot:NODE_41_length_34096_cov_2.002235.p14 type:complete len:288 gc:universal NODE_41_length_34096_cov_2.002235:26471-25608(-)